MKNISRLILYLFLGSIIIGGLLLFVFSDRIINNLQTQKGLSIVIPSPPTHIPARDTISPEILKSPRLASLVNNVINFNFDNICWHPDIVLSRQVELVSTSSSNTSLNIVSGNSVNCIQGNGWPFIVVKKK